MYDNSNKKMLIMMILDILKKYSDEQHKLTQPDIIHYLDSDYGVTCDRRSVKRNILDLVELGYQINIEGGYYLEGREFDNDEICQLYDSLLQNPHLTKDQLNSLLRKIASYANIYFGIDAEGIRGAAGTSVMDLKPAFEQLAVIKDAIDRKKKISFTLNEENGNPAGDQKVASPYELVASGQDYFMLCSMNQNDRIDIVRVASIANVFVLDDKTQPLSRMKGGKKSIPAWTRYVQQIDPKIEEEIQVQMIADVGMMDTISTLFGKKIKISPADEGKAKISLKCGEETMLRFAAAFGDRLEVTAPDELKEKISQHLKKMSAIYK